MSILLITIIILFLIKLLHDSLSLMRLWQVKMYRIDRMMSHLKEDKNIFQNNLFYISVIIIFVFLYTNQIVQELSFRAVGEKSDDVVKFLDFSLRFASFEMTKIEFILYLVLAFFLIAFLQIINEIKKRIFNRPKPTLKIVLIFSIITIFYILLFAIYWILVSAGMSKIETTEIIELLLFIYIINPLVMTLIILIINPIFNFQKKRLIKKATVKMQVLKKIKVIGITGSYGKTSTKEFLYMILNRKFKVIKTDGNNNTNIGVAYTVLNKVNDKFDYFICEMGAYRIGDIVEICDIVKPEIGILTGINQQHLELFGSIENTKKTKFELIEALPENGMAIINSNIKYQASNIKVRNTKYFSLENAENIKVYQNYIEFDIKTIFNCHSEWSDNGTKNPVTMHEELNSGIATSLCGALRNDSNINGNIIKFRLNLLGKHYIENIISAIIVAEHLGMNLKEIVKAVAEIQPNEYMMRKLNGPDNSIFIDDSYSANPDGVMAALDYLDEAYSDYKKIIVFPGIIELGNSSDEVHRKLFGRIGEVCDKAYILRWLHSPEGLWSRSVERLHRAKATMEPANGCEFVFEKDFGKVAEMLKNDLDKNTVVLFENRGAGVVMRKIRK